MTKEEVEIAEQCIQKFEQESSRRPHVSRNAHVKSLAQNDETAFSRTVFNEPHRVEEQDSGLLFEDAHQYEAVQC